MHTYRVNAVSEAQRVLPWHVRTLVQSRRPAPVQQTSRQTAQVFVHFRPILVRGFGGTTQERLTFNTFHRRNVAHSVRDAEVGAGVLVLLEQQQAHLAGLLK